MQPPRTLMRYGHLAQGRLGHPASVLSGRTNPSGHSQLRPGASGESPGRPKRSVGGAKGLDSTGAEATLPTHLPTRFPEEPFLERRPHLRGCRRHTCFTAAGAWGAQAHSAGRRTDIRRKSERVGTDRRLTWMQTKVRPPARPLCGDFLQGLQGRPESLPEPARNVRMSQEITPDGPGNPNRCQTQDGNAEFRRVVP